MKLLTGILFAVFSQLAAAQSADDAFDQLAERFIDDIGRLSPVTATYLGDHRFDHRLTEMSGNAILERLDQVKNYQRELGDISIDELSRDRQVDARMLANQLEQQIWDTEVLEEHRWNPLVYNQIAGGSIYTLMAREFAPVSERLMNAASRMEAFPEFFEQARENLDAARVPQIHAETVVRQNKGVLAIIEGMVKPAMGELSELEQQRMTSAIEIATQAVDVHQTWLEEELLPNAAGDFRIGEALFDRKLAFALNSPLSREEINRRAWSEYARVRSDMYQVASEIYRQQYPMADLPEEPDDAYQQAIIRAALEVAYRDLPPRDGIVDTARSQLEEATAFVREKDLVTVPDDPVKIILMPEFQRGVSVAYCDSPGPLDKGQDTFYAVSPIPEDWTDQQVTSFLREYNVWSLQDLTIHEAMPGHYLQIAHSNKHPSTLRAVLYSGTFVEGWAVYAEWLMVDEGYQDNNPLQDLIRLKWYLRSVTNAIMDQAIHVDGMTRDEAMKLMVEGGFQEEREAAGKWVRAQLTSSQLSTYFVGAQEHWDMRRAAEEAWGDKFNLKRYHDTVLSHGSPPAKFVKALVFNEPIPE